MWCLELLEFNCIKQTHSSYYHIYYIGSVILQIATNYIHNVHIWWKTDNPDCFRSHTVKIIFVKTEIPRNKSRHNLYVQFCKYKFVFPSWDFNWDVLTLIPSKKYPKQNNNISEATRMTNKQELWQNSRIYKIIFKDCGQIG